MQRWLPDSNRVITIDRRTELGAGGEAVVHPVLREPGLAVKLWRKPAPDAGDKLRCMLANPPPGTSGPHVSIAWPIDLVGRWGRGPVEGFAMPRVHNAVHLISVLNPVARRQRWPLFSWRYLMRTARNLAATVASLHEAGYVIGDINETNVLVSERALVTLVDCDSLQVREPGENGRVWRCRVGKGDYTPPELQREHFDRVDRTPVHDAFGLAALLFQLLMEGTHPFGGVWQGDGDPPPLATRIVAGFYPWGADGESTGNGLVQPMPVSPSLSMLPPGLVERFHRAFARGHRDPEVRPSAADWARALETAERELVVCEANPQHQHAPGLSGCPWCERRDLFGRDPFPSPDAVEEQRAAEADRQPARPPFRMPKPPMNVQGASIFLTHPPSSRRRAAVVPPRPTTSRTVKPADSRHVSYFIVIMCVLMLARVLAGTCGPPPRAGVDIPRYEPRQFDFKPIPAPQQWAPPDNAARPDPLRYGLHNRNVLDDEERARLLELLRFAQERVHNGNFDGAPGTDPPDETDDADAPDPPATWPGPYPPPVSTDPGMKDPHTLRQRD